MSYSSAHLTDNYKNKVILFVNAGYTPTKVYIDGRPYDLTRIGSTNTYSLNGLDGSFIKAGRQYYVNAEIANGDRLYPDVTLTAGQEYVFNGLFWVETASGKTDAQVNTLIDARVQDWAEVGNTDRFPVAKLQRQLLTESAYTALSVKDPNILYLTY